MEAFAEDATVPRLVAVAGWDGDRFTVYGRGESTCMVWASTWDSETDAHEFADLYGKVLAKKYPDAQAGAPDTWAGTGGGATRILRRGLDVVVLEAIPEAVLERVAGLLETSLVVKRDPADAVPSGK